jgi:hypothetical protein
MCTWSCAGLAPSVEPAEAALSATLLERIGSGESRPTTQFFSRCTSIVNSSKLTARRAVRADRSSWPLGRQILRRFAPQDELKGRHNLQLGERRYISIANGYSSSSA